MPTTHSSELPEGALLKRYELSGAYTDCYYMDLPNAITMAEYVASFYTTPLFKIERHILALILGKRSTDMNAQELALGQVSEFSAWRVEGRATNQLLLCDVLGRTRSWLMVKSMDSATSRSTRLYFGSAVIPKSRSSKGEPSFGIAFHALSGFHRLYTKALMQAAQSKLLKVTS